MLAAVMCFYLFDGSGDRGFANQAIVRAFTGKSVMLTVAIPYLVACGIALGRAPSWATLARFAAAQITTVGLSSTGLWLAPVAGMLAVATPLSLGGAASIHLKSIRTVAIGLLGSGYVVALALWVRGHIMSGDVPTTSKAANAIAVKSLALSPKFGLLGTAFEQNLGGVTVASIYVGLLLLAIPLSRTLLARRYVALFSLALAVLLMNPYFADFLRFNVYGKYTGQRALWAAPVPAAIGVCFAAIVPAAAAGLRRHLISIAALVVALFVFFAHVPTRYVLSPQNNVAYHWPPQPKVPTAAFEIVKLLTAELPPRSIVLAPEIISWFLPTVHQHPYPLLANKKYLRASGNEKHRRQLLVHEVTRFDGNPTKWLPAFLGRMEGYDVTAIVLTNSAARTPGLIETIRAGGYKQLHAVAGYKIWSKQVRAPAQPPGKS
jgi:hypothetical protein